MPAQLKVSIAIVAMLASLIVAGAAIAATNGEGSADAEIRASGDCS